MALNLPAPYTSMSARLFRVILIAGLISCITAGWVLLLELFLLNWNGGYVALLAALVTFETLVAEPELRSSQLESSSRLGVRVAEIGLMLVLLKFFSYLSLGWQALANDASQWLVQPSSFLAAPYLPTAFVLLLVWLSAFDIAGCLKMVDDYLDPQEQALGLQILKGHFLVGAYILLFAIGLRHVFSLLRDLHPTLLQANLQVWLPVVYLGLGLLLLGQARLALLRSSWVREQIPIDSHLGGRFVSWGIVFVVGIAIFALLLPAGNTVFGFTIFMWVLAIAGLIGQFLFALMLLLVSLVFAPCMALFQLQPPSGLRATPAPLPTLAPSTPPPPAVLPPDWWLQLRLGLFWVVVLTALYFLLLTYWRDRQGALNWPFARVLATWWETLRVMFANWRKRVAVRWPHPVAPTAIAIPTGGLSAVQRWRSRTPRERVMRLYLVLLERAARSGYPRRPHQTPREYAADLEPQLPAEGESLETLTEAFIEARYSAHDVTTEQIGRLQALWRRLQSALKQLGRRSPS